VYDVVLMYKGAMEIQSGCLSDGEACTQPT
jgi:hypothetical protein